MARLYAALECVVFLVACTSQGNVKHLTWWNAFLLAVTNAVYVYDFESMLFKRVWAALTVLSSLVQVTVVCMSLMGCSMIRDALGELGPWMYYFGNFALHYWPTIRATAMRPDRFNTHSPRLYFDSARIIAVYTLLNRATDVYACDVAEPVIQPLGIAVAVLFEAMLAYYFYGPLAVGWARARYFNFR